MEKEFTGEYILTKKIYKKFLNNLLITNKIIIFISALVLLFLLYNFFIVQDYSKIITYSILIILLIICIRIINNIRSTRKYKKIIKENDNKMNNKIIISDSFYIRNKENGIKINCNFRTISGIFKNSQMIIAKTKLGEGILIPKKMEGGTEKELEQYLLEKCEKIKIKRIMEIQKFVIFYIGIIITIMIFSIFLNKNPKNLIGEIANESYIKAIINIGAKEYEVSTIERIQENLDNHETIETYIENIKKYSSNYITDVYVKDEVLIITMTEHQKNMFLADYLEKINEGIKQSNENNVESNIIMNSEYTECRITYDASKNMSLSLVYDILMIMSNTNAYKRIESKVPAENFPPIKYIFIDSNTKEIVTEINDYGEYSLYKPE